MNDFVVNKFPVEIFDYKYRIPYFPLKLLIAHFIVKYTI